MNSDWCFGRAREFETWAAFYKMEQNGQAMRTAQAFRIAGRVTDELAPEILEAIGSVTGILAYLRGEKTLAQVLQDDTQNMKDQHESHDTEHGHPQA